MHQHDTDRLNHLLRTRTKLGKEALTSEDKDELIELLLKSMSDSAKVKPILGPADHVPGIDDDIDTYGPEGGSARAMDKT